MSVAPFSFDSHSFDPIRYSSPSFPLDYNTETPLREYLRHLFTDVEKHIVSTHIPLETTCEVLGGDIRYDFRGIQAFYLPERCERCVTCCCGIKWGISDMELRSYRSIGRASDLIDDFCKRINRRYVVQGGERDKSFKYFSPSNFSDYGINIRNATDIWGNQQTEMDESERANKKAQEAKRVQKVQEDNKRKNEDAVEFKKALENVPEVVKAQLERLF